MHDIFISYSRRDTEIMIQVTQTLREAGLAVWTDDGIEVGTLSWKKELADAILECQAVIVLFSPDSTESTWVHRELDFAELHQKRIYPLLISGEPADSIPFGYTTYQFIDIRANSDFAEGMQDLVASMTSHLASTNSTDDNKSTPIKTTQSSTNTHDLWQWINDEKVQFTIPHLWKRHDPIPENIEKLQILMMGKDETLFYRAIEDFSTNLIYQVTGNPLGHLNSLCTLTSISELSPIVGFLAEYRTPYFTPGIITPLGMKFYKKRIIKFLRSRYRSELSDAKWTRSATGRIWSYQWGFSSVIEGTQAMQGKTYTIFPHGRGAVCFSV